MYILKLTFFPPSEPIFCWIKISYFSLAKMNFWYSYANKISNTIYNIKTFVLIVLNNDFRFDKSTELWYLLSNITWKMLKKKQKLEFLLGTYTYKKMYKKKTSFIYVITAIYFLLSLKIVLKKNVNIVKIKRQCNS